MCIWCWYLINDWKWHGLYWRERTQFIWWTESSSCFGKVVSSICSLCLNFEWISLNYHTLNTWFTVLKQTGLSIMEPTYICLMMSSVQLMHKLLGGFYQMVLWALWCLRRPVFFVPIMFRLFYEFLRFSLDIQCVFTQMLIRCINWFQSFLYWNCAVIEIKNILLLICILNSSVVQFLK